MHKADVLDSLSVSGDSGHSAHVANASSGSSSCDRNTAPDVDDVILKIFYSVGN